ncbi:MAG: apolipoprotein N-acyltransferase [Gammaproteobacteria bacterium]|nr:apolipoprotein N-acyltransferase [Gammaproteobacteria bacterium]
MIAALRGPGAAFHRQAVSRLVAAFAVGAALNLAFAPFAWWPVGVLAPAALFALIRGLPPRRAAWVGGAFGAGLFSFGTYWLYTCLHSFGLVPVWLTVVLQSALVALMAAYTAALCFAANRLWLKPGMTRDWLVLPALWVLLEWLRGWILTGFPWLSLGYAFIDSPLTGWAPLLGVYGVTWSAVLAAVGLNIVLAPGAGRSVAARVIVAAAVASLFLLPTFAARHAWTRAAAARIPIAAVQGAVSQDQKWQISNRDATMARYANLTTRAWGARLIVWPESALPVLAGDIPDYLQSLRDTGRAHDADFAIGLVDYRPATKQYFNGLLVMSEADGGWYYKRHLVPFGEYFPVPAFIRSWMRLMNLPYDDISAGSEHQPILSAAGQKLGLTICYEDAYGSSQLEILRDATLLINVTNNAWYGDSTAPHQHLQISRMRALEAGRFLIRAANDGITAVIGPRGEIIARLPQFQEAVLRADVQPMTGLTPYARFGNYPVVIAALGSLALALWRRRRGS